tara:strand:- start:145 stop:873 length:729 start_codon:yes stop_codon:yes gene_type:complete
MFREKSKRLDVLPIFIEELSLIKQSEKILRNINLKISSKGITFIIGPNGAGKTQLLRCLHGLEKCSGLIKYGNIELSEEIKLTQSFVFQQPTLLRRNTIENVLFFSKRRKIKNYYNNAINLLNLLKLEHVLSKPALTLSSGEKQRLALARALSINPKFLFLDEPTSHLDPLSLKIIEKVIKSSSSNGTKIIFISHDLNQIKRLADDIIFMHKGEVKEYNLAKTFFKKQYSKEGKLFLQGEIV